LDRFPHASPANAEPIPSEREVGRGAPYAEINYEPPPKLIVAPRFPTFGSDSQQRALAEMQRVLLLKRRLVERLSVPETGHFSLMIHHAELVKDPVSRATESSRSNLMAAQHTIRTVYGEAVAREVADLV
jgi:hypothetical protein